MKSAIVSISAALLLAGAGAGSAFAAVPQAHNRQNTQYTQPAATRLGPSSAQSNCPQNLPSFMALDINNRGYVSEQELSQALQKQHASSRRISNLDSEFRHADTNHNGRLSRQEYDQWKDSCRDARK